MTQFRWILLICGLALWSNSALSQFVLTDPEKAIGLETRTLLVETDDFKCLPDAENAFRTHWKFNSNIEFKSGKEIDELLTPENSRDYIVLTGDVRFEVKVVKGVRQLEHAVTLALYPGENSGRRNDIEVERHFVVKMSFPYCISSEVELKLAAECLAKQVEQVSLMGEKSAKMQKPAIDESRTKMMTQKTLLLSQGMVDFTEDEAKKVYSFPLKFVSDEEIRKVILSGSAEEVIVDAVWSDRKFRWSLMAFDLKDYMPLVESRFENMKSPPKAKSDFDEATEYLSILKGKKKIDIVALKALSGEIKKANAK